MADTGAETLQLVKQCIRRRASDLQNNAVDPEDKWFLGHITPPLTDPQNKFAQDASTAIDTLSRSIRLTVMLAQKLAHEPPTPPSPALHTNAARQPIRREGEAETHPDAANDDPTICDDQRQDNQRPETESLRADRPDREDDIPARPISHHIAEIMREFMRVETNFQQPSTPQDMKSAAAAPQAASIAQVPKHTEAPTPPNAHQPGPSIPPTPFPSL